MNNKLKLPLWSEIIYLCLTVVLPIIFVIIEAYRVPHPAFRVTFTICCVAILTYIFIKKFILVKYLDKLNAQNATVELNYQTGVGDPEKNKALWVKNKIVEYVFHIVYLVLIALLLLLIIWGLQTLGMKLRGAMLFVCLLYILAFAFRIVLYVTMFYKKKNDETPSIGGE